MWLSTGWSTCWACVICSTTKKIIKDLRREDKKSILTNTGTWQTITRSLHSILVTDLQSEEFKDGKYREIVEGVENVLCMPEAPGLIAGFALLTPTTLRVGPVFPVLGFENAGPGGRQYLCVPNSAQEA